VKERNGGCMDLGKVFSAIGVQMLSDFEHLHSQIKHVGERGAEREAGLRTFLEAYLPGRFAISRGEIVDAQQQTSHQCDLVIYDHLECPLLLAGKNYRVFPAEPIFAVVEVKSVLTVKELEDAVEKIRTIKGLERKNGSIGGIIFSYKSTWKKNAIQQIASHLQRMNSRLSPEECTDLICVLDAGLIQVDLAEKDGMWCYYDFEVPILLEFLIHLLYFLSSKVSLPPEYQNYMARVGPICTVTTMPPRNTHQA
jgi:hypothetical protein